MLNKARKDIDLLTMAKVARSAVYVHNLRIDGPERPKFAPYKILQIWKNIEIGLTQNQ